MQWVSTGYLLAMGVTIPIAAWAQRVLGGRRLWILALAIFLAGSVLSSLSWNITSLIAFRVVQGIGGGIIVPLTSTLIIQAAGGRHLGRIMSVAGLPAVLGPILGPVVGGLILEHLHWSWMFWINVPFCIAGIALALRYLPADPPVSPHRIDGVGFVLMAPAFVGLLYGLSNVSKAGGVSRTDVVFPLVLGGLLLAAFVGWALHRRGGALIDLTLLRHWPLASSSILLFLSGASLYGAMLLLPLFFQETRGQSVLMTGMLLIPQGIGTLISRSTAGRLFDTMGARWLAVAGFLLAAAGTVPFAYADAHTSVLWLMGVLLLRGIGLGVATVPVMALGFQGLRNEQIPDASIITRIAQQIGGSFGTAVLAMVLLDTRTTAIPTSMAPGFHAAFWWATALTLLGMLLSLALPASPPPRAEQTAHHPQKDTALSPESVDNNEVGVTAESPVTIVGKHS